MAIVREQQCPPELAYLGPGWEWYRLEDGRGAGVYAVAAAFQDGREMSLHLRMRSFGPKTARNLHQDVAELREICRERGVTRVTGVSADPGDPRFARFVQCFGFSEPELLLVAHMEVDHGQHV